MPAPFEVELITPQSILYTGPAEYLSVPGVDGSLGIMANHAPLLTELKIGEAELREPGGDRRRFYIGGGFLEVNSNRVTILADDALGEDDLDPAEADRQVRTAQERVEASAGTPDEAAARIQQQRATARAEFLRRR